MFADHKLVITLFGVKIGLSDFTEKICGVSFFCSKFKVGWGNGV